MAFIPSSGGIPKNATQLPISGNDPTDTKSYIDTGLSGKADKCKLVWSGNKYQANDTMQISDWDNKKFYVIETISFTGQGWHNFSLVYGGYAAWQVGFWGDSTQYCRYRLQVSNTGLVTISDALNSASNTAIVGIYAIG